MVAQVETYTQRLFEPDDIIEVRRLPSGRRSWHKAGELATIADTLQRANVKGQNIHVGANPRTRTGGSKAADVQLARSIFADFDNTTIDDARDRWQRIGMDNPTLTIASGHGVHAYWRLETPTTDLKAWTQRQKELASALGSDPAVSDAPRMMRLPGFLNHKPPPAPCRIIEGAGCPIASVCSGTRTPTALAALSALAHHPEIDDAIASTLPRGTGERNRAIFAFARRLRAVPGLAGVSVGELRPIVTRWHERALPTITTKPLDETWGDFIVAWDRVRFPAGTDPLADIAARAEAAPDPPEAAIYDTREARLLVRVCRELQRAMGDRPFYLAWRTAGQLLGVSRTKAGRLLAMLVADGLLIVTKRNTTRKATRYLYDSFRDEPERRFRVFRGHVRHEHATKKG